MASETGIVSIIDSITQFVNGTQEVWNNIALPIPDGLVVYAIDTTVVKMGDGVSMYADLPELFKLSDIVLILERLNNKSDIGHKHASSDITDLKKLSRELYEDLVVNADKRTVTLPFILNDVTEVDLMIGGLTQTPSTLTKIDEATIQLGKEFVPGTPVYVVRWRDVLVTPIVEETP